MNVDKPSLLRKEIKNKMQEHVPSVAKPGQDNATRGAKIRYLAQIGVEYHNGIQEPIQQRRLNGIQT
jgi:hypothetical protein